MHNHGRPFKDAIGGWKRRERCRVWKSFGRFTCECSHKWGSAHSFRLYTQACKKCAQDTLPCCLWVNRNSKKLSQDAKKPGLPHEKSLCGACRELGDCTKSARENSDEPLDFNEFKFRDEEVQKPKSNPGREVQKPKSNPEQEAQKQKSRSRRRRRRR